MGEYIKYKGNEVKIGMLENLYYTSYQKFEKAFKDGLLSFNGDQAPEKYARPGSGFRFRFPFPDEDKFQLADIGTFNYHRGVPVKIEMITRQRQDEEWKMIAEKQFRLEITQQKLVHKEKDGKLCLTLVTRCKKSGDQTVI